MTVLFVDDEKTVRDGLKFIIDWRAYGFDSFLEGEDGADGLEKMTCFNPELTLLDIRMPKMSGLEAAEQARKAGYSGKIIMLSGYSDFKYAQSAIRSGVDAYLLKSIDEDELIAAVKKVKEDIEQKTEALLLARQNEQLARNSLLCSILLGQRPSEEALVSHHIQPNYGGFRVVLIDFGKDADEAKRRLAEDLLRSRFPEPQAESVALEGRLVLILKDAKAITQLSDAMDVAGKRAGIALFAGVGRVVDSSNEIALSYADARNSVENRFFYSSIGNVICFEGSQSQTGNAVFIDLQEYVGKIQTYVEAGASERIQTALDEMKQGIIDSGLHPEKVKGILASLCIDLLGKLQLGNPKAPYEGLKDTDIVDCIFGMDHLDDIIGYLKNEFFRVSFRIAGTNRDISTKIISYIDKNSNLDLKLESLAELFGYNCTYLGKVIRKAKGESFCTYLDKVRVQKAKELLAGSSMKVYEICGKVGFGSLNYFYKKFKQYSGDSPSEYRDRMKRSAIEIVDQLGERQWQ